MRHDQKKQCPPYGNPKGEDKEKGTESIFKAIMVENFPNQGRKMDIHIYEAQTPQIS